tara:strand:+ start:3954 stop:4178 length:225 start_codon:yes stop_codon:yes gene_type:complete
MILKHKKMHVIELKFSEQSVITRIADLEWMIEWGDDRTTEPDGALSDRRKAYDKLKYIRRDIANLQKEIVDAEA